MLNNFLFFFYIIRDHNFAILRHSHVFLKTWFVKLLLRSKISLNGFVNTNNMSRVYPTSRAFIFGDGHLPPFEDKWYRKRRDCFLNVYWNSTDRLLLSLEGIYGWKKPIKLLASLKTFCQRNSLLANAAVVKITNCYTSAIGMLNIKSIHVQ